MTKACAECGAAIELFAMGQRRADCCPTCDYWLAIIDGVSPSWTHEPLDPASVVRFKGRHFIINPDAPRGYRGPIGYCGSRFVVHFADGRVVETRNLWDQDVIPERFRARLPDNATAIEGMHVDDAPSRQREKRSHMSRGRNA